MKIELDTPKLIDVGENPELRKKIHEVLGWVDYCKDVSALLAGIEDRLSLADDYKDDSHVLKAHLDDLKFLLKKLTPSTKAEIGDEKIQEIKAAIVEILNMCKYSK